MPLRPPPKAQPPSHPRQGGWATHAPGGSTIPTPKTPRRSLLKRRIDAEHRRTRIITHLQTHGAQGTRDIARALHIPPATINRDLQILQTLGLAHHTKNPHGGHTWTATTREARFLAKVQAIAAQNLPPTEEYAANLRAIRETYADLSYTELRATLPPSMLAHLDIVFPDGHGLAP